MRLPGALKRACDALPRGIGGVAPDDDVEAAVRSMLISAVQATRSTLSTLRDLIDGIFLLISRGEWATFLKSALG